MRRNAHLAVGAASVAIGAVLLGTPGQAAVEAGQVACNVGGDPGLIVPSSRPLSCTFSGPAGAEHYVGSVSKLGVDIGYLAGGQMLWDVVAPTAYPVPGSLAGSYSGVSASAAVGPGVGANALIDGSNRSFTLQPVSVEGQSGLDVSGGIATINPQYAP
jgi:hypothetical protein